MKQMFKLFLLVVILFFNSNHLTAQTQIIRGTVIDEDTREPLIGVKITIINSEPLIGTITDTQGVFRLENVPIGRTNLKIAYIGYDDKLLSNIEVNSAKEIILDIRLIESISQMKEVVVTSTSKSGDAINEMAIVSTRSISAEETSRYAGGFNDPAKITSNFAGVTNSQDGGNDIIIRGNSPKYVQWRLEGAEITNPNHFGDPSALSGSVGALNNNLLSTSDFYTGAFSPEFGNALSGVYDVRMRKGNNEKFEGIFGLGLLGSDITVEGPFSKNYKGSYLANFRYSTIGLASNLGFVPVEGVTLNFQDAAFKFWLPTKSLGNFSIFGLQGSSSFQFLDIDPNVLVTPGNDFAQTTIQEDYTKSSNLFNVGINHIIKTSKKSYVKTTFLYSIEGIKDDVFDNIIQPDSSLSTRLNFQSKLKKATYNLNSIYKLKINAKNKLSMGIRFTLFEQGLAQSFLDTSATRQTLVDFTNNISTLRSFVSWKFTPNKKLSFVTGINNTNVLFNQKYTAEPRFAVNYLINRINAISFGFGLHSRMESIHNYFARVEAPNGILTTPNMDLGLLKAAHFVMGYEKYLTEKLKVKGEIYYQYLYNIPVENNPNSSYTTLNEGVELNYVNLVNEGTGRNYGAELTVERLFSKGFYCLINASLYESKYTALDNVERNTKYNGNYLVNFLAGKEFFGLGEKNNQIFGINIKAFYGGGRYFIPLLRDENGNTAVDVNNNLIFDYSKAYENKLDDLVNIVFSLSYKWNSKKTTHELFLNIDNVTNSKARLREFYDINEPNGIAYERQVGLIPNFLYRIYF
ncbi:MAG: carboxypeptidase-like regulatory domain-containing protein [Crocinitomicaceae bacterium]